VDWNGMPLRWLILILALILVAMMSVVITRAEFTRINYEISQLDQRAEILRMEIAEKELELERLRNPAVIRKRLAEWRLGRQQRAPK
jgi:hypothetical protein